MNTEPAIQIRDLGKRYLLGGQMRLDQTLPEVVSTAVGRLFGRKTNIRKPSKEFWALRDISLNVHQGEVVGLIGANGAGKSTLLKVLSQITDPTEGEVTMRGRVGSLLEVGTGFHPELTGRENIYLNGAILGMTRREIATQFDDIVDFSGVEAFLDTPVKRYSSGMAVRLAFAVAAHLDPEILIVDEVLAVGDVQFQEKCLGKMKDVATGEGRTVIFVSHNMAAVQALCTRGILLEQGQVTADGEVNAVVDQYLGKQAETTSEAYQCDTPPNDQAWIHAATLRTDHQTAAASFLMTDPLHVHMDVEVAQRSNLSLSVQVLESNHSPVFHYHTVDSPFDVPSLPGRHQVVARIPANHLYPGDYLVVLTLSDTAGARYTKLHQTPPLRMEVRQDPALCARPLSRQAGLIYSHCDWHWRSDLEAAA